VVFDCFRFCFVGIWSAVGTFYQTYCFLQMLMLLFLFLQLLNMLLVTCIPSLYFQPYCSLFSSTWFCLIVCCKSNEMHMHLQISANIHRMGLAVSTWLSEKPSVTSASVGDSSLKVLTVKDGVKNGGRDVQNGSRR
jgi:hypothetical protein